MNNKNNIKNIINAIYGKNSVSRKPSIEAFTTGTVDDFIIDIYDPAMTLPDGHKAITYNPDSIESQITTLRQACAIHLMLSMLDICDEDGGLGDHCVYEIYTQDNHYCDDITVFSMENDNEFISDRDSHLIEDHINNGGIRHVLETIFMPSWELNDHNIFTAVGFLIMCHYNYKGLRVIKTNLMTTDDLKASILMAREYIYNN